MNGRTARKRRREAGLFEFTDKIMLADEREQWGRDNPHRQLKQGYLRVMHVLDRFAELFDPEVDAYTHLSFTTFLEGCTDAFIEALAVDGDQGLVSGPRPATTRLDLARLFEMVVHMQVNRRNKHLPKRDWYRMPQEPTAAFVMAYARIEVAAARLWRHPIIVLDCGTTLNEFATMGYPCYRKLGDQEVKNRIYQWTPSCPDRLFRDFLSSLRSAAASDMAAHTDVENPLEFTEGSPEWGCAPIHYGVLDVLHGTMRDYDCDRDLYRACFMGVDLRPDPDDPEHHVLRPDPPHRTYHDRDYEPISTLRTLAGGSQWRLDGMLHVIRAVLDHSICDEACVVLYGEGSNGKSTFLNLIDTMATRNDQALRERLVCNVSPIAMENPNFASRLVGKLLNIANELEVGKSVSSTSAFKCAVSHDHFNTRLLFHDPANSIFNGMMFFATNGVLSSSDHSAGFWRRVCALDFGSTTFQGSEKVPEIKELFFRDPEVVTYVCYVALFEAPAIDKLEHDPYVKSSSDRFHNMSDSCLQLAVNCLEADREEGVTAIPTSWFHDQVVAAAQYSSPSLRVPSETKPAWTSIMRQACEQVGFVAPRDTDGRRGIRLRASAWMSGGTGAARAMDVVAPGVRQGGFNLVYDDHGHARHVAPELAQDRVRGWVIWQPTWASHVEATSSGKVGAADAATGGEPVPGPAPATELRLEDDVDYDSVMSPADYAASLDGDGLAEAARARERASGDIPADIIPATSTAISMLLGYYQDGPTPVGLGRAEAATSWLASHPDAPIGSVPRYVLGITGFGPDGTPDTGGREA